jgi:hypothetical protein
MPSRRESRLDVEICRCSVESPFRRTNSATRSAHCKILSMIFLLAKCRGRHGFDGSGAGAGASDVCAEQFLVIGEHLAVFASTRDADVKLLLVDGRQRTGRRHVDRAAGRASAESANNPRKCAVRASDFPRTVQGRGQAKRAVHTRPGIGFGRGLSAATMKESDGRLSKQEIPASSSNGAAVGRFLGNSFPVLIALCPSR